VIQQESRLKVADNTGAKVAEAGREGEAVILATFDRELLRSQRAAWGLFRDRRPELYAPITTLDGRAAGPPVAAVRGV